MWIFQLEYIFMLMIGIGFIDLIYDGLVPSAIRAPQENEN